MKIENKENKLRGIYPSILITSFKGKTNSSTLLLNKLRANNVDKLKLTNSFKTSEKELKKNKNIIDIVSKSISILCHELSNYELDGADYLLTLKTENIALLDYSKIDELYELGYKEGKKFLQNNKI